MDGRRVALTAAVVLAAMLAGCWDRREIEERNTVLAVGADLCDSGAPSCMTLTRQIVIPGRVSMAGRTAQSAGTRPVDVLVTKGKDDIDASGKAQAQLHRDMHFGHIRMFVLGEDLARSGLQEYMRWVHGLPEQGYLEWFAIAEGKAGALVEAAPSLEKLPALYLFNLLSSAQRAGRVQRVYLSDFQITLANGGEDPVVPLLSMAGKDRPMLAGLAVFRGATMVGKLSLAESITYAQLRGLRRGSEMLHVPLPGGHEADVRIREREAVSRVKGTGEHIETAFDVALEADLVRLSAPLESQDLNVIRQIEELAARQVKSDAQALMQKLQQDLGADILGIGQRVRAYLPSRWREISNWREAYPKVRVQVQVKVHVRRTGLTSH